MFDRILRSIRKTLGDTAPNAKDRLRQEEDWLAELSDSAAKARALDLLADSDRFVATPGSALSVLPSWISPSTREFFGTFVAVSAKFADFSVGVSHIGPSPTEDRLLQVGWYGEHVELCLSPLDGLVYRLADDVRGDERREGSDATLWHVVLRLAVELEYVSPTP